jgi:antirestriction protein ArdC
MKKEYQQQSLERARNNHSMMNYATIIRGFTARGIPSDEIIPRENVLTLPAWNALGRRVKKGETGVKILTWKNYTDKKTGEEKTYPSNTTVFHVSQTDTK